MHNGWQNRTPALIRGYQADAPYFVLADFVRNFGQDTAIAARFAHARGT